MDIVVGWPLFLGLLLATGAVVGRFAILPFVPGTTELLDDALRREALRVGRFGAWLAAIGLVGAFVRQFLEFRDPFGTLGGEFSLLMTTPWADTWLRGAAAVGLLVVSLRVAGRWPGPGWMLAAFAVFWADTFPALSGHAAAAEKNLWLAIGADTAHVIAAGAWIGGLALVLWLERNRSLLDPAMTSLLPRLIPSFSRVAMASVGLLVATGALASFRELDHFSDLWTSSYGRLLFAKLAVVGVVLGLGGLNWQRLTPRLGTESGQSGMRRAATTEFILANVVLLLTALLARTSHAGQ